MQVPISPEVSVEPSVKLRPPETASRSSLASSCASVLPVLGCSGSEAWTWRGFLVGMKSSLRYLAQYRNVLCNLMATLRRQQLRTSDPEGQEATDRPLVLDCSCGSSTVTCSRSGARIRASDQFQGEPSPTIGR